MSDFDSRGPEEQHSFLDQFTKPGTVAGATVNLAVTTIGAGILSLPMAFQSAGISISLGVIVIVATFTVISIKYLAECVEKLNLNSYEELSRELLGPTMENIARWMLIAYSWGASIGYVVLIGEMLDPYASDIVHMFPFVSEAWARQFGMFLFWLVLMFPLSLIRDIGKLAYSSFFAIAAAAYLSLFIIYRYAFPLTVGKLGPHHHEHRTQYLEVPHKCETFTPVYYNLNIMMLLALPIMMYSFDCQTLVFQLYHSLINPSYQKMTKVGLYAIIIASSAYFCIGLFGYLSFGECVKGNILMNYNPRVDTGAAVGYVLYCIPVVMAYAITLFPCRDALFQWMYDITPGSPVRVKNTPFYSIAVALSVGCVLCAIFVPGILTVISLLGGACSSTLCFTYPGAFAWRMDRLGVIKANFSRKVWIISMLALGIVGGAFGTGVAIFKTTQGYE